MPNRRQFNSFLVAAITLSGYHLINSWFGCSRDKKLLDLAAAMHFREKNPPALNQVCAGLEAYTRANPDALEYLASQGYDGHVFLGLVDLDKSNASALAKWDAFICFTRLKHVDADVASILSDGGGSLVFENISKLSLEAARELAMSNGLCGLAMDSISLDVAQELVKHSLKLDLIVRIQPSTEVLDELCNHAGYELAISWDHQPGNEPGDFISPNTNKIVSINHIQSTELAINLNLVSIKELNEDQWYIGNYLQTFNE